MILKIRDWKDHFENASSLKLVRLYWVPVPNKTDGEGYTALVDHPDGAAHLGAWYAIVEAASRQMPRERRGELPGGIPHDIGGICRSLGRTSRLPPAVFSAVIPRLLEIGWLEKVAESADALGESANVSAESAERMEWNGIEVQDKKEQQQPAAKSTPLLDGLETDAETPPDHPRVVRPDVQAAPSETADHLSPCGIAIQEIAQSMHDRHPALRRCSCAEIETKLRAILKHEGVKGNAKIDRLVAIERNHAAWCSTTKWTEEAGKFAKGLDNWLAPTIGRFNEPPPANGGAPPGVRLVPPGTKFHPFDPFNPRHHQNEDSADVH